MLTKRGSLDLSITAIVVIVIAFVVLGLGLSLTKTIFKGAQDKLPEAFAVTQLESEPTSENPITIAQTVEISRTDAKTMSIGFYNRGENTAVGATFLIQSCLKKDQTAVEADELPSIASISQNVPPSSAQGYSIILTENGLTAGTYICTITVACVSGSSGCDASAPPYEQKQFFLKVIA